MNTSQAVVHVFRTARDTSDRLTEGTPLTLEQGLQPALPSVLVDSGTRYQEIEGFGGSFTEAAAVTLSKMSRDCLLYTSDAADELT